MSTATRTIVDLDRWEQALPGLVPAYREAKPFPYGQFDDFLDP